MTFSKRDCIYNSELSRARPNFSNIINRNINNTHDVLATMNWLTNPPTQFVSAKKCNEFACFFHHKIENVGISICSINKMYLNKQKNITFVSEFTATDGRT